MPEDHTRTESQLEQATAGRGAPQETASERTSPIPRVLTELLPTYPRQRPYVAVPAGSSPDAATQRVPGGNQPIGQQASPVVADDPLAQPLAVEATTVLNPVRPPRSAPVAGMGASASDARRRMLRRSGVIAASVLGAMVLIYAADLAVAGSSVPRGVSVAGVTVGGLSRTAAEQKLRQQIEPRLTKPIQLRAGEVQGTLDPKAAGLTLDWGATLDQAGAQPWNPWTRLTSFFTTREVGVATRTDNVKLTSALEALRPQLDKVPVEGGIHFQGATAQPVDPKPGQKLDTAKAASAVLADWVSGKEIVLPVTTAPVAITAEAVHTALDQVATPAVAGQVTVNGDGKDATLTPTVIAAALTFEPNGKGGLNPKLDQAKIVGALAPQLAATEHPGTDAQVIILAGQPVVKPSQDGRGVDYDKTLAGLMDVLRRPDHRALKAEYVGKPAKVTTDQANHLGIKEVIGEYVTGGFAKDSGTNIQVVAAKVNGAIVKPGETFSLNGYTGPRTAAQGYVDAGIILNGAPDRAVGGGISQFATTLYNAAYFAGMADAGHQEHSYYISRYPPAREATVFENPDGSSVIDIKFKNDSPTGVAIETIWTPSSITVRLWGTKRYNVESITGDKTDFTEPNTVTKKPGEACVAGNGAPGFKVTDTRVLRDLSGREVRRDTRTKRYDPVPKIACSP